MGLDQSLYWIGEPSKSQVKRFRHKNLSEANYAVGMQYLSENDYYDERYKYIRRYMISEEVYLNELDWNLLKADCGMPEDAPVCSIGPSCVKFGKAVNVGEVKEFHIDMYDARYWKPVLQKQYFYLSDEIYQWRNNYEIQNLFNLSFPDIWCDYKNEYQTINSGYYPVIDVLDRMKQIDSNFAREYEEGTDNVFYKSNW